MFYEKFLQLCSERGIKPSAVALALGINKSAISHWKNGKNGPSDITVQRIADYFDIPVSTLTGETDAKEKSPSVNTDELSDQRRAVLALLEQTPDDVLETLAPALLKILGK